MKCQLCARPCGRCVLCTISLNPCSFFFLLTQKRKLGLREVKSLSQEHVQIFCSFYSFPQIPATAAFSFLQSCSCERCPLSKHQGHRRYPLEQETLSAHPIVCFPPWETGGENMYVVMELSIFGQTLSSHSSFIHLTSIYQAPTMCQAMFSEL